MNEEELRRVVDELQRVIGDTQHTIERFETYGMNEKMPEDYDRLLAIMDQAVKRQRTYTLAMLAWQRNDRHRR